MSATVIPFSSHRIRRSLGPVPAVITGSQVLNGQHGALLELRLTMRLADVPSQQRQSLPGLIHSGDLLTLTLETAGGGEGG